MNTTALLYACASGVTGSARRHFDDTARFPRKADNRLPLLHMCPGNEFVVSTRLSGANADANCANYAPFLKKHDLYFSQAIIWDALIRGSTCNDTLDSRVNSLPLLYKLPRDHIAHLR